MDDLDLEILQGLLLDARESYESMGQVLSITPYEVKKRITALHDSGVIIQFVTNLNFQVFGEIPCYSLVTVADGVIQSDLMTQMARHEGRKITGGATSLDRKMQVIHTFRSSQDLNANVAYLKSFPGVVSIENAILLMPKVYDFKGLNLQRDLSKIQWRIIRALKNDCRRTDVEVAKELGVATKTVKRNLEILRGKGIIFFMVQVDNAAGDWPAYTLIVRFTKLNPKSLGMIPKIVKHLFYQWQIANEETVMSTVYVARLRDVENQVKEIRGLQDVKEVISFIPTKMYYFESWLDDLVEQMARE